jgi:dipeptidyl aminopeptidase/acylaminoacyl peptidase
VYVGSLRGERRVLLRSQRTALYADPGYLLFRQEDNLIARPFDPEQMTLSGEPMPLGLKVGGSSIGALWASASSNGTLVTGVARDTQAVLAWVDRRGAVLKRFETIGRFHDLSASPDGSRLAVNQGVLTSDLWTMDLARGLLTRITTSPENDWVTSWAPDGRTLAFTINNDLYTMPSDGSAPPKFVRKNVVLTWCTDWSPNGGLLVCQRWSPATLWDLVLIDVNDPRTLTSVAQSESHELHARFSPDAKWIAYTSDESGRFEVYLQPLASGGKIRVSMAGGAFPRWRSDGRELYYMAPDASLMAADVHWSQGVPKIGAAQTLFMTDHPDRSYAGTDYVPSIDGQRFLVTMPPAPTSPPALVITLNWPELLGRR